MFWKVFSLLPRECKNSFLELPQQSQPMSMVLMLTSRASPLMQRMVISNSSESFRSSVVRMTFSYLWTTISPAPTPSSITVVSRQSMQITSFLWLTMSITTEVKRLVRMLPFLSLKKVSQINCQKITLQFTKLKILFVLILRSDTE